MHLVHLPSVVRTKGACVLVFDWVIMCLIACLSGLVYSFLYHIEPINLALFACSSLRWSLNFLTACVCVFVSSYASEPTFIFIFLALKSLLLSLSIMLCCKQELFGVICVCAQSVWCTAKAWGQLGWRDRKQSLEKKKRKGDSCVLSGIPKKLYDLNDKRRLGPCIMY